LRLIIIILPIAAVRATFPKPRSPAPVGASPRCTVLMQPPPFRAHIWCTRTPPPDRLNRLYDCFWCQLICWHRSCIYRGKWLHH